MPQCENSSYKSATFQTDWKLFQWSGKFSKSPETFRTVKKICRLSRTLQTVLKLSRQSGNFPHLFAFLLMFRLHFMGKLVNMHNIFWMRKQFLVSNADAPTTFLGIWSPSAFNCYSPLSVLLAILASNKGRNNIWAKL